MQEVVIVSGSRTPVGSFGGSLKTIPVVDLGATVLGDVLTKAGLRPETPAATHQYAPAFMQQNGLIDLERDAGHWDAGHTPVAVDEVIMGNVLQAAQGQNTARQAMMRAGYRKETPAFTINKICGSGLKAIGLAAASIMTGQADIIVAGGQESMSNAPMTLPKARWGHRMEVSGKGEVIDLMVFDGLYEIFYGYHMGITAENIVKQYNISREDQDRLAVLSHQRARTAISDGLFAEEIVPVTVTSRRGDTIVATDERPMDTSMEKMARLRPAFTPDGSVTAGNASGINDGGAAVLLMSRQKASELGCTPLATVKSFATGGLDPAYMGLGPVPAIRKALEHCRMTIGDIDMIELNEAFAAQAIACMEELDIPVDKANELGSGISLGHPIGCTGARQMVTALHQMQRKDYTTGLISMCIGGGMGMAMVIERT